MADPVLCKICNVRRPRRACPGVHGDICALCCGQEREVTVNCPFECEYLQAARQHERPQPIDPGMMPHPDIRVSEDFIRSHEELLLFCGFSILQAALRTPGAVDSDIEAALDALTRTHRTLESGLVYETRPENTVAAAIQEGMERSLADYQKERTEKGGLGSFRNAEILGVLVFLQRLAKQYENGRPKGRAFLDFLRRQMPLTRVPETQSSIIL